MRPSTMASRRRVCRSEGQQRTTLPRRRRRVPRPRLRRRRLSPYLKTFAGIDVRVSEPTPAKGAPNLLHRDQEATRKPRLPLKSPQRAMYNVHDNRYNHCKW